MSVWIVRHACAGHRGDWDGDDDDRPLDPTGWRQAEALADVVRPGRPRRLSSSPTRRCLQTLAPLAARLGLEVTTDDGLRADAGVSALLALVDDAGEAGTVACTHGELLESLLEVLRRRGTDVPGSPSDERLLRKGAAWEVATGGTSLCLHVPVELLDCPHHATG